MKTHYDFKKEWERTKKQLLQLGQEARSLARKSESEIVKFSKKGKLHLDVTATNLKLEKLYYLIGKEYVKLKDDAKPTAKLSKLIEEVKNLNKEQKVLNRKLKIK